MEFWSDSTYGVCPPVTAEAVRDAEKLLGVRLPESLLELLRVQNGGGVVPSRSAFPMTEPTSWAPDHVPFECLMGIGPSGSAMTILDTPYLVEEWGLPCSLVLLVGDGHWWIALDYRACGPAGEPVVTWFDVELESESALAPDFRSFLAGLAPTDLFE